jgi:hypothetical protein
MSRRREPLPLGDGPDRDAARMLGLSVEDFHLKLPRLLSRGFPAPDPDTERFDLEAINQWRRRRHPQLFNDPLTSNPEARDANGVVRARLEAIYG